MEGWQNGRTDTLTKNFINLHKHEGSFQTSLNYGYFINEHQFGWPAPDEAWQARSQTFIGWPACNSKSSFFEFIKNPGSFFQFIENPGSFYRFVENPGSFLWLISRNGDSFLMFTIIVHDADFFKLKIPVFLSMPQHFSWPLFYLSRTALISNMERVVQKGTSALKFLLQDRDPCVLVVGSEATSTVLNSCPTQGNPYHT